MAKLVNPFIQISKRLASLQAKSLKINEELTALASLVAVELKKQESAPAEPSKVAPAKAPAAKGSAQVAKKPGSTKPDAAAPTAAPKKRGRPSKK